MFGLAECPQLPGASSAPRPLRPRRRPSSIVFPKRSGSAGQPRTATYLSRPSLLPGYAAKKLLRQSGRQRVGLASTRLGNPNNFERSGGSGRVSDRRSRLANAPIPSVQVELGSAVVAYRLAVGEERSVAARDTSQ
jgi:hypothetical protein